MSTGENLNTRHELNYPYRKLGLFNLKVEIQYDNQYITYPNKYLPIPLTQIP